MCVVRANIERSDGKYRKDKAKRKQQVEAQVKSSNKHKKGAQSQKQGEKMRHFQSKQLADTVESITGAIAHSAGLFSAQDFLLKLGVLKYNVATYD